MITNLLILLCTGFSLYMWSTSANLAFSTNAFLDGRFYTLLTGLFVHANGLHLAGNMLFLYIFGNSLEADVGEQRTLVVFFTGGILSFILSIPFYPGADMLGASAAIFSVMAAVLLVRPPEYSIQFISLGPLALLYFIFNIESVGSGGNVAYISHIIGFVIGLFFGARWNKEWKKSLVLVILLLVVYVMLYNYLKV